MNINDFHSHFGRFGGGPMRSNRFRLSFPAPQVMLHKFQDSRFMELWCEQITFPGYLIGGHDVRRWTYGPNEKRQTTPTTVPLQCTFLSDSNGHVWDFFNHWLQSIMPHTSDSRGINTIWGPSRTRRSPSMIYELSYKNEYATDLHLEIFDIAGNVKAKVICTEAYPTQVPEIPLNWGDHNGVVRFNVTFEYLDWYAETSTE